MVQPPDLLIYLKCSVPTLVSQIQKRGREYEENIRLDYLKRLNEHYNRWIDNYSEGQLLVIDCDKNKFAESEEHFGEIISKVDSMLFGLFKSPESIHIIKDRFGGLFLFPDSMDGFPTNRIHNSHAYFTKRYLAISNTVKFTSERVFPFKSSN